MTHIQTQALSHIPSDIVSLGDYERVAADFIRRDILEYINGGVADKLKIKNGYKILISQ